MLMQTLFIAGILFLLSYNYVIPPLRYTLLGLVMVFVIGSFVQYIFYYWETHMTKVRVIIFWVLFSVMYTRAEQFIISKPKNKNISVKRNSADWLNSMKILSMRKQRQPYLQQNASKNSYRAWVILCMRLKRVVWKNRERNLIARALLEKAYREEKNAAYNARAACCFKKFQKQIVKSFYLKGKNYGKS